MSHQTLSWSQNDKQIFAQSWTVDSPKAVIAIVHGFAEHGGRYSAVASYFNKKGVSVIAIDQFGHGNTKGIRGYSPSLDATLDSIANLIKEAEKLANGAPVFLWGHSMGGNVVVNFLLRRQPTNVKGAIATAPWFRLGFEPPKFKIMLAKIMKNIYAPFPEKANLDTNALSRDKAIVKAYDEDPLVHNQATAGTFFETYDAGLWAIENAPLLKNKLLLMHGTADQLIAHKGSEDFYANADKNLVTFKSWEGYYHELHNEPEPDRTKVLETIASWIETA
jgi:acylglycerol lipase